MREKHIVRGVRTIFDVSKGRARYATIRTRIMDAAKIDGIHICQLIAAMVIASIGLNLNSTEAIIGAMLICPLMGSVVAIAYSVAAMDMRVFRHAVAGILLQCFICVITSTIYFAFSPLSTETSELLTYSSATIWDLLIALVGGFAGALGLSRRLEPSTLLSGVAVATALMPPLCTVGFGLAHANGVLALSALYEFLINVVFIAFGSTVVLVWLRIPLVGDLDGDGQEDEEEREEAERESHVLRKRLIIGLIIFAIPCVSFSMQVVRKSLEQDGTVFQTVDLYDTEHVTKELQVVCPHFVSYRVGAENSYRALQDAVERRIVATVVTSEELNYVSKRTVEALIRINTDVDEVTFELEEP